MLTVKVSELFLSIQGESSYAGLPCFFVRLSGCNLRCRYCDTPGAYEGGSDMPVREVVDACSRSRAPLIEITGGEPLAQEAFPELMETLLKENGKTVLVETNGSLDISVVPKGAVRIMDVKCPGSGEHTRMDMSNMDRLQPGDEVKFVLTGRQDYDWAVSVLREYDLVNRCAWVFFSPAHGILNGASLAQWILADALPVRLGFQLHKFMDFR